MTKHSLISKKRGTDCLASKEAGFTLVELAIVMIIIGLLIAGILKGQEMIANAQVTATISQIKAIEAATSTFRDKYAALPGDMRNPGERLPNCDAANMCEPGAGTQGNGIIESDFGVLPADNSEALAYFLQLRAAELLAGYDGAGATASFGNTIPAASIGGGYYIGHTHETGAPAATGFEVAEMRRGHYLVLAGDATAGAVIDDNNAALTAGQAARIDRKLDDGLPQSGAVHGDNTGADPTVCTFTNADGVIAYQEGEQAANCAIAIRIQG